MTNENPKEKNEERDVEWTFDFANLAESFNRMMSSLAGDAEIKTSAFTVTKEGVQSAQIQVDFSVGKNFVQAASSAFLLDATLQHVGEIEFVDEGTSEKNIRLKQKTDFKLSGKPLQEGFRAFANREDLRWDIGLSPDVPISLSLDGGVGPTMVDLTGLQVKYLEADTGVGTLTLTLPADVADMQVEVDGGVGQTRIFVPDHTWGVLDVDGGIGAVEITIPPNAAVQIKAKAGLGAIHVPDSLNRMSKQDFMEQGGVWQSEGFELAQKRLVILYEGGVGQLTVREAEII